MLDLNKSRLFETWIGEVLSTVAAVEEGCALIHVLEGGVGKVRPSTGGTTQVFAGVALSRGSVPSIVPIIENLPVPASSPYTASLSKVINGSDLRVTHIAANGTRTALTAGAASNAGEYSISNGVITVNSSKASGTLEVSYRYAISLQEAIYKFSFNQLAGSDTSDIGTVGVIDTGAVYTSCFDVTSDWGTFTGGTPVYIGANGNFTLTSSGNTEVNSVVIGVPGVNNSYLGLHLNP